VETRTKRKPLKIDDWVWVKLGYPVRTTKYMGQIVEIDHSTKRRQVAGAQFGLRWFDLKDLREWNP
jgi:hypothetical protein